MTLREVIEAGVPSDEEIAEIRADAIEAIQYRDSSMAHDVLRLIRLIDELKAAEVTLGRYRMTSENTPEESDEKLRKGETVRLIGSYDSLYVVAEDEDDRGGVRFEGWGDTLYSAHNYERVPSLQPNSETNPASDRVPPKSEQTSEVDPTQPHRFDFETEAPVGDDCKHCRLPWGAPVHSEWRTANPPSKTLRERFDEIVSLIDSQGVGWQDDTAVLLSTTIEWAKENGFTDAVEKLEGGHDGRQG